MPRKKVDFGAKPSPSNPDDWVSDRAVGAAASAAKDDEPVKMKRLTLDIPESLHRAIKKKAVESGVTMAEQLRDLLEEHYGER